MPWPQGTVFSQLLGSVISTVNHPLRSPFSYASMDKGFLLEEEEEEEDDEVDDNDIQ